MIDTPKIIQTGEQRTAAIHIVCKRSEMMQVFGPALQELLGTLAKQGVQPAGPQFAYHFQMSPEQFDFELGVPVEKAVKPEGRVKPGKLPALEIARTVYRGPFQGLPGAWGEFRDWLDAQKLQHGPSLREVYLTDPAKNPDASTWETQLNRPIVR